MFCGNCNTFFQNLIEIEIFCDIINLFTITFDYFLSKNIYLKVTFTALIYTQLLTLEKRKYI